MPLVKCKMCGEEIEYHQNQAVVTCSSCGTMQCLPNSNSIRKTELYNQANQLRLDGDFDKAETLFRRILNYDGTDPEIHWNLALCHYGVMYRMSTDTQKWIPTVNSPQIYSFFDDKEYKLAFQYASEEQKEAFRREAIAINTAQDILRAYVQKEKQHDIYICCVKTDADGKDTLDCSLAKDILTKLTQEGFNIFCSFINLSSKEGNVLEPEALAALNSAKVMIVLGTNADFFTHYLVRNEWRRYLNYINSGLTKVLIPIYRDMDPCDLPEDFCHFKSQDMSKNGFISELVKRIKEVVDSVTIESFQDTNEQYAEIYNNAVELMKTSDCEDDFQIAADAFRSISGYKNATVLEKICLENADEYHKDTIYVSAKGNMNANLMSAYETAVKEFQTISGWRDADKQIEICMEKIDKIKRKERSSSKSLRHKYRTGFNDRNKSSKNMVEIVPVIIFLFFLLAGLVYVKKVAIPDIKYANALAHNYRGNIIDAYEGFLELGDYKNSKEMSNNLYKKYKSEKLQRSKTGVSVFWGSYEQDNNPANGKEDIEWFVFDTKDEKALLVSKYVIDTQPYNDSCTDITWEDCSLRAWLNDSFLNSAFSTDEQLAIISSQVSPDRNTRYNTIPGNPTDDKVFLLSISEADSYDRCGLPMDCSPTLYAEALGISNLKTKSGKSTCRWWLRTPGSNQDKASLVIFNGKVDELGAFVDNDNIGIRPALWIDLNSAVNYMATE